MRFRIHVIQKLQAQRLRKKKPQNAVFLPETISVREWIVCNDRNTGKERSDEA